LGLQEDKDEMVRDSLRPVFTELNNHWVRATEANKIMIESLGYEYSGYVNGLPEERYNLGSGDNRMYEYCGDIMSTDCDIIKELTVWPDGTFVDGASKGTYNDAGECTSDSVADTLKERKARYGTFTKHADIAQGFKAIMVAAPSWAICSNDKKQALEMFADKMARILNGDPNYDDSWRDIAGYAQLIVNDLQEVI